MGTFKIVYNVITAMTVASVHSFETRGEITTDSCNLVALIIPTFLAAFLWGSRSGLVGLLWTWSEFLEPVAHSTVHRVLQVNQTSTSSSSLHPGCGWLSLAIHLQL